MTDLGSRLTGIPIDTRGGVNGETLVMRGGVYAPGSLGVDVGFSGASMKKTTDQLNITGYTLTVVTFQTVEHDTDSFADLANNKFVMPFDATVRITGSVAFEDLDAAGQARIWIRKGGIRIKESAIGQSPGVSDINNMTLSIVHTLVALQGDEFDLQVVIGDTSVGDIVAQGTDYSIDGTFLQIEVLGTTGGQSNLLGEVVLTADQLNIDFTNIPATYSDLHLVIKVRTDRAANDLDGVKLQLGTGGILDTGSNYDSFAVEQNLGATLKAEDQAVDRMRMGGRFSIPGDSAPADAFGAMVIDIPGYTDIVGHQSVISWSGIASADVSPDALRTGRSIGLWRNTGVVDTIRLSSENAANFVAGSSFRLYGEPVLGGGSGLVKGDFLPGDLYLGGQIFENQPATSRTELYAVGAGRSNSPIWQPATIGEYDDYFDKDTSSKWTEIAPDTGALDWSYNFENRFGLYRGLYGSTSATIGANDIGGVVKPLTGIITTTDFIQTAWTMVRAFSSGGLRDHGGLFLTDGTTTSANIVGVGMNSDNNASGRVHTLTGTLGSIVSTLRHFPAGHGMTGMPIHYRLTYTALNEFTAAWSLDGVTFTTIFAISTTMIPTHGGFYLTDDGVDQQQGIFHYFHSNVIS